jgi:hypothetical protein
VEESESKDWRRYENGNSNVEKLKVKRSEIWHNVISTVAKENMAKVKSAGSIYEKRNESSRISENSLQ